MLTDELVVIAYSPTAEGFFRGYSGYQVLYRIYRLFGIRIQKVEVDREVVPHWHYVQERTLGCSEWRSKFQKEIQEQTERRKGNG